jgi:hypothetical protein
MPIKPQTARRFDRSSAVARYWLAHCEGFRVRGPLKGTVEQVVAAPDLKTAQALVVRTRGRRRNIPVEAVDVVVPASREIVVDAEQFTPAGERSRALAGSGSRAVSAVAATTARVTPRAARSLADVLKALALLVAIGAATVARVTVAVAAYAVHALALAGTRVRADLHARQLAASEKRSQH